MASLIARARPWAVALCAAAALQLAHAANSVMIWPVDPAIEDDQRATALWLENRGTDNVALQVRVFAWSQSGTAENYENQERIIASPPVVQVPPGQRQLVRLMHTARAQDGREEAYRVLIDELPDSDAAANAAKDASNSIGVKLQIRYSIPLFVYGKGIWAKPRLDKARDPATAAKPELRWHTVNEGGTHYLVLRNNGTAHARLTSVRWVGQGEPKVINQGLLGYVLANSEMRWPLEAPPPPGQAPEARINGAEPAQAIAAQ